MADKQKALETALLQIEKQYGKGSVMKLGVLAVLLSDLPLKDALAYLKESGAQMVEIGCGGYPGTAHADAVSSHLRNLNCSGKQKTALIDAVIQTARQQ